MSGQYKDYGWKSAAASHMHVHFIPHVFGLAGEIKPGTRVLDVGCGNGYTCGEFLKRGWHATGLDLSTEGIEVARKSYPAGRFELLAGDDKVLQNLNEAPYDLITSTEVVEYLYDPRGYARGYYAALKPGGRLICSTPYHGYLKNLVLPLAGKWDAHANPLWDGGHIKLWSRMTLSSLLAETGFYNLKFRGAGRLPYLWMTMVMSADKPSA